MFRFSEWWSHLFTGSRPKTQKGPMILWNLYNSCAPHTPPAHWLFTSFVSPFAQYHTTGLGERPHGNQHQVLGYGVKAAPSSPHIPLYVACQINVGGELMRVWWWFFSIGPHKAGGRPRDMTLPWTTQLTLHPLCQHPQNLQSPLPFHLPRPHWTSPCPPLVPAVIRLPISRSMANSLLSLSLSLSHRVCQGRPGAWLPGGHSAARLHRLETSRSLFFFHSFFFSFILLSPFFCFPLFTP